MYVCLIYTNSSANNDVTFFLCFKKKQQSRTKPIPVARHLYEARLPEAAESGGEDAEVAS